MFRMNFVPIVLKISKSQESTSFLHVNYTTWGILRAMWNLGSRPVTRLHPLGLELFVEANTAFPLATSAGQGSKTERPLLATR